MIDGGGGGGGGGGATMSLDTMFFYCHMIKFFSDREIICFILQF
jgi:hypothetical protein